jgi:spore germination protein YaaH
VKRLCFAIVIVAVLAGFQPAVAAAAAAGSPSMTPLHAAPIQAASSPHREIFGFALASSLSDPTVGYPSWNFSLLSTVAFFGLHINDDGTIASDSGLTVWNSSALTNLVTAAHASGAKVVVTVVEQDFTGMTHMCAALTNRATTVSQTVAQVSAKGVDGVNIDFEGVNGTCPNGQSTRSMLTDLANQFRTALPAGSYLSVDTYASSAADPAGFFDIAGLNAYVDSFFVMAYDLEYSNYSRPPTSCTSFCLGPTAPLGGYYYNDTSTAGQYVSVVTASKVILGVPYYGRKACVASATPNAVPTATVEADTYLSASTESSSSEVQAGSYVTHRDANDPSGQERWDTWFNTTLNCERELYWDDTVSLGLKYDLVNNDGLRGVGIWNLNYGGGAAELWGALAGHFERCTSVTVTAAPASPAQAGTAVTLSGTASGCPDPVYEFWTQAPGGAWTVAQPYSASATFNWNTVGLPAGTYRYSVWARDADSALGYDAFFPGTSYTLSPAPCTAVSASAAPSSPQDAGTTVTITAGATGCPNARYEFWTKAPGGSWTIAQPYSSSTTFTWHTTPPAGTYSFSVWARDASSAATYDAYFPGTAYTLTTTPCTSVTASASPASPQAAGTTVTITASASGCSNPHYEFWIQGTGGGWTIAQPYSSAATFTWNTTPPAGTYHYSVWLRDASSGASYDTYFPGTAFTLTTTPCTSVTASATPASPQTAGTAVTITASASGCANPRYEFWIQAPGGSWTIMQPYSSAASFSWNTSGLDAGSYKYSVWARDASSGASYDAYFPGTAYTLN